MENVVRSHPVSVVTGSKKSPMDWRTPNDTHRINAPAILAIHTDSSIHCIRVGVAGSDMNKERSEKDEEPGKRTKKRAGLFIGVEFFF
jgi:hypothetical protein